MRLIDADALWNNVERTLYYDDTDRDKIEDLVMSAPTVDAMPHKAGKWLSPVIGKIDCVCSECRAQSDEGFDYCPSCGAKMSGWAK